MPISKKKTNHAVKTPPKTVAVKAKTKAAVPRAAAVRATMTRYAAPGAALLGSGLVAAAGIVLRSQLERLIQAGIKSAVAGGASARHVAADQLDIEKLLAHVGLQRRRRSLTGAGLGLLAGVVAGSALAVWLAPVVKKELADRKTLDGASKESPANGASNYAPTV